MTAVEIQRAYNVYQNNSSIVKDAFDDDELRDRFSILCKRLDLLDTDTHRDFVLELLKEYRVYGLNYYSKYITEMLIECAKSQDGVLKETDIGYAALIAPEDVGKPKSSISVMYMLKDTFRRPLKYFKGKSFYSVGKGTSISEETLISRGYKLILVDDFVGTGDTAMNCINEWVRKGVEKKNIIVCSVCAHSLGQQRLKSEGIPLFFCIDEKRHLSDVYSGQILESKKKMMYEIEKKMKGLSPKLYNGYGESEALITMINTPNNTFPVFWYSGEGEAVAPFRRL